MVVGREPTAAQTQKSNPSTAWASVRDRLTLPRDFQTHNKIHHEAWALFSYQISISNSTMQKEDSHYIKMSTYVWSTKCR
jgi:hypothetical protein